MQTFGAQERPIVHIVGSWAPRSIAHFKRAFPTVHLHSNLASLRRDESDGDVDLIIIAPPTKDKQGRWQLRSTLGEGEYQTASVITLGEVGHVLLRVGGLGRLRLAAEACGERAAEVVNLRSRIGPTSPPVHASGADLRASPHIVFEAYQPQNRTLLREWFEEASVSTAKHSRRCLALVSVCPRGRGIAWFPSGSSKPAVLATAIARKWAREGVATLTDLPLNEPAAPKSLRLRRAQAELRQAEVERDAAIATYDAQLTQLSARVAELEDLEHEGSGALLTTQGTTLKKAVAEALDFIGFTVTDVDDERAEGEAEDEDLRISLSSRPDWEGIVEVKGKERRGYNRTDQTQVRKHRTRYLLSEQREPDVVMVVLNLGFKLPFGNRPRALAGQPQWNVELAEEGYWSIVETPELFRLREAFEVPPAGLAEAVADSRVLLSADEILSLFEGQ